MSTDTDGAPPSVSPPGPDERPGAPGPGPRVPDARGEPTEPSTGRRRRADGNGTSAWLRQEIARRVAENRSGGGRHAARDDTVAAAPAAGPPWIHEPHEPPTADPGATGPPHPTAAGPRPSTPGPPPTGTGPHPTSTGRNPTGTGPHPTSTGRNPTGTGPHPTSTGRNPTGTGPHPSSTGRNPTGTGAHPAAPGEPRPPRGGPRAFPPPGPAGPAARPPAGPPLAGPPPVGSQPVGSQPAGSPPVGPQPPGAGPSAGTVPPPYTALAGGSAGVLGGPSIPPGHHPAGRPRRPARDGERHPGESQPLHRTLRGTPAPYDLGEPPAARPEAAPGPPARALGAPPAPPRPPEAAPAPQFAVPDTDDDLEATVVQPPLAAAPASLLPASAPSRPPGSAGAGPLTAPTDALADGPIAVRRPADVADPDLAAPERVRVVLSERKRPQTPVRTVEIVQEGTGVGQLLRSSLIRTQLLVAVGFAAVAAVTLGALPLLFALFPVIGRAEVFGLRLPWLLLGVLVYPFLLGLGWWHTRTAERVEQSFADHVQD